MIKKENLKIGQIVYKEEFWTQRIISAKVSTIDETGVRLDGLFYVKPNGKDFEHERFYGSTVGKFEDIYITAKEAYDAQKNKSKLKIEEYCNEVKTIEDLLNFPIKHSFGVEEYTNYEAIAAYKIMCKKIANIDIIE
jgi:hypothetical protein